MYFLQRQWLDFKTNRSYHKGPHEPNILIKRNDVTHTHAHTHTRTHTHARTHARAPFPVPWHPFYKSFCSLFWAPVLAWRKCFRASDPLSAEREMTQSSSALRVRQGGGGDGDVVVELYVLMLTDERTGGVRRIRSRTKLFRLNMSLRTW